MEDLISTIGLIRDPNVQVELCFCRKYRISRNTRYAFYRGEIDKTVTEELKKWLIDNIQQLENREISKFAEGGEGSIFSIELDDINTWNSFEENAFSLENQEEFTDLKVIRDNLNNYIIYIKLEDALIGQIRRMQPKNVLDKKGRFSMFFDNSTFNVLREDKGVRLDKYCDFLFIVKENKKLGIITNKEKFESIFDMYEQYQQEAENIISSSEIFLSFGDQTRMIEMVKTDRIIQKMLRNPVAQRGFSEVKGEDIVRIKEDLKDSVKFEINEKGEIVFPSENEKAAFRDLIKVIGHHFNETLFQKHIIESTPVRFLRE